eukprot:gene11003-12251_t
MVTDDEGLTTVKEWPCLYGQRVEIVYSFPSPISSSPVSLTVSAAKRNDSLGANLDCFVDPGQPDSSIALYANYIWPGSIVLADYLVSHPEVVKDRAVLEFGAGTALPSLTSCRLGGKLVIATDFPDPIILENMRHLKELNQCSNLVVQPHKWGDADSNDTQSLLLANHGQGYDVILLAEVLWKDTYALHRSLLASVNRFLRRPDGIVLLAVAHRPTDNHEPCHDLEFIGLAKELYKLDAALLVRSDRYRDAIEGEPAEVFLYRLSQGTDGVESDAGFQ